MHSLIDRIPMIQMIISKLSQGIKFNNTLKKYLRYNKKCKNKAIILIIISYPISKK